MTGWTGVLPREVRALEEVSGNWAEWARYGQMTWTRLHGINVSRRPLELCTSGRPLVRRAELKTIHQLVRPVFSMVRIPSPPR
jgi:hypothetical protein